MPAGVIVYHGPRAEIIPFFSTLGFALPERKGAADFLQEITSRKDQKVRAYRDCSVCIVVLAEFRRCAPFSAAVM